MRRGIEKGSVRGEYKKYTDQEIIDVISKYETIKDLRASDEIHFYYLAKRRGLDSYLPIKRTKAMNVVGSSLEKKLLAKEDKLKRKEEIRIQRAKDKLDKVNEKIQKRLDKRSKREIIQDLTGELIDRTLAKNMYCCEIIDDTTIKCGRCFNITTSISIKNSHICKKCYNQYLHLKRMGIDSNPHNVKDEFCNTIITHYEKTFFVGIKVEEKLQNYLTTVGYGFIFK